MSRRRFDCFGQYHPITVKVPRGPHTITARDFNDGIISGCRTKPLPAARAVIIKTKQLSLVEVTPSTPAIIGGFTMPFSNPGHESEPYLQNKKPIVDDVFYPNLIN